MFHFLIKFCDQKKEKATFFFDENICNNKLQLVRIFQEDSADTAHYRRDTDTLTFRTPGKNNIFLNFFEKS